MNEKKEEKYIVIKPEIFLAFNEPYPDTPQELARLIQKHPEAILDNSPGSEDEHFVLMLKDINTRHALQAYARSAASYGMTALSRMVSCLAERSGILSSYKKFPD